MKKKCGEGTHVYCIFLVGYVQRQPKGVKRLLTKTAVFQFAAGWSPTEIKSIELW